MFRGEQRMQQCPIVMLACGLTRAMPAVLQAAIRRAWARKDFKHKRAAAVSIQSKARATFAKAEYEKARRAAIRFQVWRGAHMRPSESRACIACHGSPWPTF